MGCGIDELIEMSHEPELLPQVREELAFRKPLRKARKLAKELGCPTKVRPTTREQLTAEGRAPYAVVAPDIANAFGLVDGPHVEVL